MRTMTPPRSASILVSRALRSLPECIESPMTIIYGRQDDGIPLAIGGPRHHSSAAVLFSDTRGARIVSYSTIR